MDMGSFLGLPYSTPLTISDDQNVAVQQTQNFNIITTNMGGQRWTFMITLGHLFGPQEITGKLMAHKSKHQYHTPFEIMAPNIAKFKLPVETPNFTAVSAVQSNKNTVRVNPGANSVLRAVPTGSLIRFENHKKIYMVDQITISGNDIDWELLPRLRENVSAGEVVTVNPMIEVRYVPGFPIAMAFSNTGFHVPMISVVENI